jgi:hypothetical protein
MKREYDKVFYYETLIRQQLERNKKLNNRVSILSFLFILLLFCLIYYIY